MFSTAINADLSKIKNAVFECLKQAQITAEKIDLIILTGGSTEIPAVKDALCRVFPQAQISAENKLTSVGLGLAFDGYHYY